MADVHNVKGGVNRPGDADPSKKKEVTEKKFKDLMRIKKTDPEEQRKRKRQDEAQEEQKASQVTQSAAQTSEETDLPSSPFELSPSAGSTPSYKSPLSDDNTSDSADAPYIAPLPPSSSSSEIDEEDDFSDLSSMTSFAPLDRSLLPPSEDSSSIDKERKADQPAMVESKKTQKLPPHKKTSVKKAGAPKEEIKKTLPAPMPSSVKKQKAPVKKEKELKKSSSSAEEDATQAAQLVAPPSELNTPFQPAKKKKIELEVIKKENARHPQLDLPTPSLPSSPVETMASPLSLGGSDSPFYRLTPEVSRLLERVGGILTVMHLSGVTETTLHLNNPQFVQSAFFGAEIVIREFSTAPKQFNIELIGGRPAVDLFLANEQQLLAAFQTNNYNFRVHRIDASLSTRSEEGSDIKKIKQKQVKRKQEGEV